MQSVRMSGVAILVGSILLICLMALHPTSHDAVLNAPVHGGLMLALAVSFVGILGVADRVGWMRIDVRAGVLFHGIGAFWMCAAALVNGFLVSSLSGLDEGLSAEVKEVIYSLCHDANQFSVKLGAGAFVVSMLAWSSSLPGGAQGPRRTKWLGLALGLGFGVALLCDALVFDLHGMTLFAVGLSSWSLGLGLWLLRWRPQ